jgi:copper transport protein
MSRWSKTLTVLFAGVLLLFALPPQTSAHGYIVRSIPGDQAELERAPVRVQLWFSEPLEADISTITVYDRDRTIIAQGGLDATDDALLTARLPSDLADGAYLTELKIAFASDGHVIYETQTFYVGVGAVTGFGGVGSSDLPIALEVVWRALVYASHLLLFGILTTYSLVLIPAWGNPDYPAGLLPPRVMRRLYWIAGLALSAALLGNILALIQQSMVFFEADVTRVISDGLWNTVRTGTRVGETWNARMVFLGVVTALLFASVYLRREYPGAVSRFWAASAWGMALVLGTISVTSHAAGSLTLPWVALFSDWLHMLASALWVGGVAALALTVPTALAPLQHDARRAALSAALRRFSSLAVVGLVIVVATGVYNASNWFTEPDDIPTTYGGALALKLVLAALLIGVGAAHHIALRPERYSRFTAVFNAITQANRKDASGWIRTLRLETGLALGVLIGVGILSATPVPDQTISGRSAPPPSAAQQIGDLMVTTTISPGGPGVNTFDVLLTRAGQPVNDLPVTLRMTNPARDQRGAVQPLEPLGDGLYTSANADIDRADTWWMTVQIDGEQAAFAWQIDANAAVVTSRPPTAIHALALIGVIGACLFALYPSMQRFYRMLDLSPSSVAVAVSASAATVILIVVSIVVINQSSAQYARDIAPPPSVINNVLPTGESLAQGAALIAACGWRDAPDLDTLIQQLDRTRDETVFAMTRDGWRGLPACADTLTDSERWHIVNFIRSRER